MRCFLSWGLGAGGMVNNDFTFRYLVTKVFLLSRLVLVLGEGGDGDSRRSSLRLFCLISSWPFVDADVAGVVLAESVGGFVVCDVGSAMVIDELLPFDPSCMRTTAILV